MQDSPPCVQRDCQKGNQTARLARGTIRPVSRLTVPSACTPLPSMPERIYEALPRLVPPAPPRSTTWLANIAFPCLLLSATTVRQSRHWWAENGVYTYYFYLYICYIFVQIIWVYRFCIEFSFFKDHRTHNYKELWSDLSHLYVWLYLNLGEGGLYWSKGPRLFPVRVLLNQYVEEYRQNISTMWASKMP
jgi:hypothetical protein